jgi:hypothetical protein
MVMAGLYRQAVGYDRIVILVESEALRSKSIVTKNRDVIFTLVYRVCL